MMKKVIAAGFAVLITVSVGGVSSDAAPPVVAKVPAVASPTCPTLQLHDSGQAVKELQYRLRSFGWSVAVDGNFGSQTEFIVQQFQKVSGFLQDGIAGPITQKGLGCGKPAPAVVLTKVVNPKPAPAAPVAAPEPAVEPSSGELGNLPTKSSEACADMDTYRQAAGLPAAFGGNVLNKSSIGYREGGCRNDSVSPNGCCYGYFQIQSSHLRHSGYKDRINSECGVFVLSDMFGSSDAQKRGNACAAAVIFSMSGWTPWGGHP